MCENCSSNHCPENYINSAEHSQKLIMPEESNDEYIYKVWGQSDEGFSEKCAGGAQPITV